VLHYCTRQATLFFVISYTREITSLILWFLLLSLFSSCTGDETSNVAVKEGRGTNHPQEIPSETKGEYLRGVRTAVFIFTGRRTAELLNIKIVFSVSLKMYF
jgi:hypothetical protein